MPDTYCVAGVCLLRCRRLNILMRTVYFIRVVLIVDVDYVHNKLMMLDVDRLQNIAFNLKYNTKLAVNEIEISVSQPCFRGIVISFLQR